MKPKFTLLTALAIAASAVPVAADDARRPERPTRGLPDALKPYDANEDGRLSREEYKAFIDDRRPDTPKSEWDTDGDGKLSHEEIEAARAAMRAKLEERFLARFNEADEDEDGFLSEEEFKSTLPDDVSDERAAAAFGRLDADDDGKISKDEFLKFNGLRPRPDAPRPPKPRPDRPKPQPPVLPPLPDFLKALDLDGNGILSRDEIKKAIEEGHWPPRPQPPADGGGEGEGDGDGDGGDGTTGGDGSTAG